MVTPPHKRNSKTTYSKTPKAKEYTVRGKTKTGKTHSVRIAKKDAHVVDEQLYPETVETRRMLGNFESSIRRVKGDDFVATPRRGPAEPGRAAAKGMDRSPKRQINMGANTEAQRNIDETMMINERKVRRNH